LVTRFLFVFVLTALESISRVEDLKNKPLLPKRLVRFLHQDLLSHPEHFLQRLDPNILLDPNCRRFATDQASMGTEASVPGFR